MLPTGLGRRINKNEPCATVAIGTSAAILLGARQQKKQLLFCWHTACLQLCTDCPLQSAQSGWKSLPGLTGFWLTSGSLDVCAVEHSPLFGRDLLLPLGPQRTRPGSGSASGDEAPRAAHPAGEACGVGTMGTGADRDVSQHRAEFLRRASQIHTHISSRCSGRNLSPRRFLLAGFPLIFIHWHALVKIVTNTVISNICPVINANNGSNIPFNDHLSSNKGCN